MGRKGDYARETVYKKIAQAFGENYVGVVDKKIYVNEKDEDGTEIQFSIAITMPKNTIAKQGDVASSGELEPTPIVASSNFEISDAENEKIQQLMNELGIED